ncbi:MAG: diacylglycerol kinase family protein [Cyanobacteria bacterium J06598_1]
MFQRDSQFSRDRKLSRNDALPHEPLTPNNTTKINAALPNDIAAVNPAVNPTAKRDASDLERNQSWQIAPNLFTSFKYAWAGISYAFQTQRNFRVHTGIGTIAMLLCWTLRIPRAEVAIICLTIGAVLVMEILNTALESLVDLTVGQTYHELAKIAKDCAAGAVLMAAIVALLIAVLIFAKPLWMMVSAYMVAL